MSAILVFLLIILLLGGGFAPVWPYSRGYGWGPSGFFGVLLLVLVILTATGRL